MVSNLNAPNNNIDPEDREPLNLMFANQFKRNTSSEINGFYPKSC